MVKTITKNAYAKINLGLDVTGVREDGYHLLRMIMQQIDLCDTLTVTARMRDGSEDVSEKVLPHSQSAASAEEGRWDGSEKASAKGSPYSRPAAPEEKGLRGGFEPGRITLIDESGLSPAGEDNLICRAVRMMADAYGLCAEFEIKLTKRIPVAAGLAGGSTDAAAAFLAVRDLLVPEASDQELMEMAVRLGADIPYCIAGGTKLAEGIGEKLTELPSMPACGIVLVKPEASASTAHVYRALDALGGYRHPDIDGQIAAIGAGDLAGLSRRCENVLELVTGKSLPLIGRIEGFFMEQGALAARMSGSGPSVFAIFDTMEKAETARDFFLSTELAAGCRSFCVRPVN